jgi:hypothetical protein
LAAIPGQPAVEQGLSELCANIDRRNTVQEHIFTHIEQFVAVKTHMVDGEVRMPKWWGSGSQPVWYLVTLAILPEGTPSGRKNSYRPSADQWLRKVLGCPASSDGFALGFA